MRRSSKKNPLCRIYKISKGFVLYATEIFNSVAYHDLLPSAAKCLPLFLFKYSILNKDGGSKPLEFPYSEAHRVIGISKATFKKAIVDLVAKGFINIVVQGGMKSSGRGASHYTLSEDFRRYKVETLQQIKVINLNENDDPPCPFY